MTPKRKRRRHERLMAEDPHCANCGVEVVYFVPRPHERMPDNFATLEHVNSRNQSVPRPAIGKLVLWCWRCNQDRSEAELAAMPLEELHRRARNGHRGLALEEAGQ